MSGATTMYALKPVVLLTSEINEPKIMYEMKNIHEVHEPIVTCRKAYETTNIISNITEQVIKFLKDPLPEVAELEVRQEKILTQLAELKAQVSTLSGILKNSEQAQSRICRSKKKVHIEFVINANPSDPPYSIAALRKILADTNIKLSTHVHSSISEKPAEFLRTLESISDADNQVEVSLIWKKVSELEVVISGIHGTPLLGEVNFLRYLSRVLRQPNYEDQPNSLESTVIDSVLDLCHELPFQKMSKKMYSLLSILSAKLGKKLWFLGEEPSIADAALWSALKRIEIKQLPSDLSSWFNRCDKTFWQQ